VFKKACKSQAFLVFVSFIIRNLVIPFMRHFLFILLLSSHLTCYSQQVFSEGVITYDVTIDPPANQEGIVQYKGTYTIVAKGSIVKETLQLENGYQTALIFNHRDKTVYSLKKAGQKHVAIQLDWSQLQNKRQKYEGYSLKPLTDKKKIAGMDASHASIVYKNGTTSDVYYTNDWTAGNIVFDNYPGIEYLLLSFSNRHDDGLIIYFTARKIEAIPVDNADIRIPTHYKMISNSEYQEMTGK
jgi:hypothetical protein